MPIFILKNYKDLGSLKVKIIIQNREWVVCAGDLFVSLKRVLTDHIFLVNDTLAPRNTFSVKTINDKQEKPELRR